MALDYRDKIEYNRDIHHIRNYMDDDIVLFRNPKVRHDVKSKRLKDKKSGVNNTYDVVTTKEIDAKRPYRDDYPAAVVLCCVMESKHEEIIMKSGKPRIPRFHYGESANQEKSSPYKNTTLLEGFKTIGGIWKRNGTCKYPIGNCAEQHAAEILLNENPQCGLHDIEFSSAFRPRTDEVIPYCENCTKLFF